MDADPKKIQGIVRNLDDYVANLKQLASVPKEDLLGDFTRVGAMRYYLHVAVQCCLDIANHLIAAKGLRSPLDYADAFVVLGEAGIVPQEFVPTLQQMARIRNRLVHLYWSVDDETLYHILTTEQGDFDRIKANALASQLPTD